MDDGFARGKRLRKAFALADEIGLSDDERYELSAFFLGEESSWKNLNSMQLDRILDMMDGYVIITHIVNNRQQ
jgi:hypothetical protein